MINGKCIKVFLFPLLYIFYILNTGFWVAELGENCPVDQVVDTPSECKKALAQLGMKYLEFSSGKPYTSSTRAAGCFSYASGEAGRFNTVTNPASASATGSTPHTAGICAPGIIVLTI